MSRRQRGSAAGISLFPFLAVLICTMGSLIVLLVLFVQQAKIYANSLIAAERNNAQAKSSEGTAKLRAEREEHEWRQQVLEQQRTEKTQELSDAVDQLAHLDDHIRRLKSRAAELMKLAQDIDLGKQLKDSDRETAAAELKRLREEIERKKREAEETKKKLANAQRWFALIPYEGPNGTRRRPIYIECTEVGIILQPEGIALMPNDFNGPLGPGNPLDAALRMKREYLQRAGETATPYPLLVVRPDGIIAYSVARNAMKAWDDEFGYELIDGEKKLTFGDPDQGLVSLLQTTVRTARQKQAALAAAMPRKFQSNEPLTSFHPDSAVNEITGGAPAPPREGGGGLGGAGRGVGGAQAGTGAKGVGSSPGYASGGKSGTGGEPGGTGQAGTGQPGSAAGGTGGGDSTGQGTGNQFAGQGASGGTNQTGGKAGGPAGKQTGSAGSGGGYSQGNSSPGGNGGASGSMNGSYAGAASSSTSGGSEGAAGGGEAGESAGEASSMMNFSANKKPSRRGANWGLPDARNHATAITRPIRVVLEQQRVVIMPERGDDRLPKEIPLKGAELSQQETDQFVAAVQKHMQQWGLAVQNGYWKPLLKLEVAPDAEVRHRQIETALQGSGFEVQRKLR